MINTIIKAIFRSRMNLSRIEKYIEKMPAADSVSGMGENCTDKVKIAAVQRENKPVKSVESYIDI